MSFFSFLKRNPFRRASKESFSLVVNIGSGSVSGGIIKFTEKAGVEIAHYIKEIIPFQDQVSISRHNELMKSALEQMTSHLQKAVLKNSAGLDQKFPKLDRVFYVFSSPWSISQTKTIRIKEPKDFKVTKSYLDKIIDKQEKEFQSKISSSGKIIEKKIIQIKNNGYIITDIQDKYARDLEITVHFTIVPEDILNIVDQVVSKTFNIKDIWCHSLSLALFTVIRDMFPQKEDFIHIDISEEITDVSIVKDGIMTSCASIPFGRNNFIRELSTVLKVPADVADSMMNMHCTKSNDDLATLKLSVAMDKAATSWLLKIFEILEGFKEKIYVPESIFLVVNNDLTSFLRDKLQKHDFKVELIDYRKIKPHIANNDIMFRLELQFLDNLYKI
jgi:cell division ATPase FtsA